MKCTISSFVYKVIGFGILFVVSTVTFFVTDIELSAKMSWIFLLVIGFSPFVLSDGDKLMEPCAIRDMECLSHSTEQFLEHTCRGIPQYDIKALDPLVFSEPLTYVVDVGLGIVLQFENLNVTGLRNQKISDFQMDTVAKSVLLKTRADLNIVSNIRIEIEGKPFTGVYHATASVLGTARYNYELKGDSKGVEYFMVGPETLTCEVIEEPKVSLNQQLEETLTNDPLAKSKQTPYLANKDNYRKQTICKIAEEAYEVVVHNIRAAAKILPKTAFFKDI